MPSLAALTISKREPLELHPQQPACSAVRRQNEPVNDLVGQILHTAVEAIIAMALVKSAKEGSHPSRPIPTINSDRPHAGGRQRAKCSDAIADGSQAGEEDRRRPGGIG